MKVAYEFKHPDIPNNLIGDEKRLIEILNHLLENAAKFTRDKDPQVTITISVLEKSAEHVDLQFSVQDNGIGIQTDHHEMIFKPFFQVDETITRKYDGVGIGLSVCKQLIELMGGEIRITSALDIGTTFCFTLRLKRQENETLFNFDLFAETQNSVEIVTDIQKTALTEPDLETITPGVMKIASDCVVLTTKNVLKNIPTRHS